jgi:protein ImuB
LLIYWVIEDLVHRRPIGPIANKSPNPQSYNSVIDQQITNRKICNAHFMYACLHIPRVPDRPAPSRDALLGFAREFAPRVELCGEQGALIDVDGLERLIGDTRSVANALRRAAADRGWPAHVAVAGTRTAARLLASARVGVTIVPAGGEAAALAPLPLRTLTSVVQPFRAAPAARKAGLKPCTTADDAADVAVTTLRRWGLKTLGDLAALPASDLFERLGRDGLRWQQIARGEDERPLVPAAPDERFEASLELEWPIDGLQPLEFVLGRLLDDLCARLARRDRGAVALDVRLRLVTRDLHTRHLDLPVALADPRVLRTLAVLDLDAHPPQAAIDAVTVTAQPAPGPIIHYSLLTRAAPAPEALSTLLARLSGLMEPGIAALLDTHRPDAFEMNPFAIRNAECGSPKPACDATREGGRISSILRRFRPPRPARVVCEHGRPTRVTAGNGASGQIEACAGPWRTSGDWWSHRWRRESWDVGLTTGGVYRIFKDRETDRWYVEGMID